MSQCRPNIVCRVPTTNPNHPQGPDTHGCSRRSVRRCAERQLAEVMAERASPSGKRATVEPCIGDGAVEGSPACRFRGGDLNAPDLLIRDRGIDPSSRGHTGYDHRLTIRLCIVCEFLTHSQLELLDSPFQSILDNSPSIGDYWPKRLVCSIERATNQRDQDGRSAADIQVFSQAACTSDHGGVRFNLVRLDLVEHRRLDRGEIQNG